MHVTGWNPSVRLTTECVSVTPQPNSGSRERSCGYPLLLLRAQTASKSVQVLELTGGDAVGVTYWHFLALLQHRIVPAMPLIPLDGCLIHSGQAACRRMLALACVSVWAGSWRHVVWLVMPAEVRSALQAIDVY